MKYSRRGNWLCCIQMRRITLLSLLRPLSPTSRTSTKNVAQNANTNDDLKHVHLYLGLFLARIFAHSLLGPRDVSVCRVFTPTHHPSDITHRRFQAFSGQ